MISALIALASAVAPAVQKQKLRVDGDTFIVTRRGDQITVDRREKAFRRNTGPEQREAMRKIARDVTGCELKNEFFTIWKFELEATLVCPNVSTAVK